MSTLAQRLLDGPVADAVINRLREGETPQAIARWLQVELVIHTERDPRDLVAAIQEVFIQRVPLEERLELALVGRSAVSQTVAKQRRDESTLELLTRLTDLQLGRVELGHNLERKLGVPSGSVGNDIELARRLLRDRDSLERKTGSTTQTTGGALTPELRLKLGKVVMKLTRETLTLGEPIETEPEADPADNDLPLDVDYRAAVTAEHD